MEKEQIHCYHGTLAQDKNWKQPKLVAASNELSRPGYSKFTANEFQDVKDTLHEKIAVLAQLIR